MNKIIVCLLLASLFCSAYGNPLPQSGNVEQQDGNDPAVDAGNNTGDQTGDNLADKIAALTSVNTADAGDSAADVQGIEDVKKGFGSTTGVTASSLFGGSLGNSSGKIASDAAGGLIGRGFLTSSDTLKSAFPGGISG